MVNLVRINGKLFVYSNKKESLKDINGYFTNAAAKGLLKFVDKKGENLNIGASSKSHNKYTSKLSAQTISLLTEQKNNYEDVLIGKIKPKHKKKIEKPKKVMVEMGIETEPISQKVKTNIKQPRGYWYEIYPEPKKTYIIKFQRMQKGSFETKGARGYGIIEKQVPQGFKPIKIETTGKQKYDENTHLRSYSTRTGKNTDVHWVKGYLNGKPVEIRVSINEEKKLQGIQ